MAGVRCRRSPGMPALLAVSFAGFSGYAALISVAPLWVVRGGATRWAPAWSTRCCCCSRWPPRPLGAGGAGPVRLRRGDRRRAGPARPAGPGLRPVRGAGAGAGAVRVARGRLRRAHGHRQRGGGPAGAARSAGRGDRGVRAGGRAAHAAAAAALGAAGRHVGFGAVFAAGRAAAGRPPGGARRSPGRWPAAGPGPHTGSAGAGRRAGAGPRAAGPPRGRRTCSPGRPVDADPALGDPGRWSPADVPAPAGAVQPAGGASLFLLSWARR